MSKSRQIRRAVVPLATAGLLVLAGAGVASAHVTAHSPDQLTRGGDAEIVFRAPNEEAAATFGRLEVDFPAAAPIGDVDVKPLTGWTYQVNMVHLARPVKMADDTVTDAVGSIVWTAQPGNAIKPGEFQEFSVSVEGLPTNTTSLVMPAKQTYSDGVVINWNQPTVAGQPEPEHPAPHLTLLPATATDTAATGTAGNGTAAPAASGGNTGIWLGGIGVLLGALALGLSLGALLRTRRRTVITDEVDEADDGTTAPGAAT